MTRKTEIALLQILTLVVSLMWLYAGAAILGFVSL